MSWSYVAFWISFKSLLNIHSIGITRVKRAKTKDINSLFTSLSHPVVTLPTVTPPSSDTSPSKSVSQEWDNQQSHENEKPNLTKAKKRKLEQCHPDQPKRPKKPLSKYK